MKNGANASALDQSQQKPADLTADKEIKFICEHFEEYKKFMAEKQKTKMDKLDNKTNNIIQ